LHEGVRIRPHAIGATARDALARTGGRARVLSRLAAGAYLTAGAEILALGRPDAMLHPRAILTTASLAADEVSFDPAGLAPWRPRPLGTAPTISVLGERWRALAGRAVALGTPAGFGALLVGATLPFPLYAVGDEVRALSRACAGADSALRLLGVGAGLTPSGDDLVGGAFFARSVFAARVAAPEAWRGAGRLVAAAAPGRTHPISAALLGDLVAGQGWASLHDLAAALAHQAGATGEEAARRLVRLGHSSGWDLLTGVGVGLGALA
jgi:hypothetical protein